MSSLYYFLQLQRPGCQILSIIMNPYSIYCHDHKARGGGVFLAVNQSIPSRIINVAENIEALIFK